MRAVCRLLLGFFVLLPAPAFGQLRFELVSNALTAERFGSSGSAWIDVDGDGFTDVAIAARDSLPNRIFRNDRGRFVPVALPDALRDANAVAWGDVDGDGDPDLVLALQDGVGVYEVRVNGGAFELLPFVRSGDVASDVRPRGSHDAVALGDLDADGDLDLVAAAHGGGGVRVFANDGTGTFTTLQRDFFPFASYFGGAHIVDLDSDGRVDLLFTGSPLPLFRAGSFIYWNDSGDWTADRRASLADQVGGLGSSVTDVDADGDLDVFLAGWREDTPSVLYLNEGDRVFRPSPIAFPARIVGSAFTDFDGDGALDLVTSSGYSDVGQIELWVGDGRGGFVSRPVPGLTDVPGRYSGLSVVDHDRDGRPDVYVSSIREPARLFRNVSAPAASWLQVELRGRAGGVPVPGAQVDFEIELGDSLRAYSITLHQQSGFGGHGEPVAQIAFPRTARVRSVRVSWPNGVVTDVREPPRDARIVLEAPLSGE